MRGKARIRQTRLWHFAGQIKRRLFLELWMRELWTPPSPPPHAYKVATVLGYARRFDITTFVETGTYQGDMVEAARSHFGNIWSIELGDDLYEAASRRFQAWPTVTIVHGDSAVVLEEVLDGLLGPCLFWLDGHFSGGGTARGLLETPIIAELDSVLRRTGFDDVVLIDDARLFGQGNWPSIDRLTTIFTEHRPGWRFEVRGDIIRAHR